ncbi:MAG: four helix bundle protein [Ignavibacteria bacterium GWB2_35_12]|nr:MAG: four helix bundle protein [Ignavibacteria bacterium GWA2_35_8]OGU39416.1 MAG: four helix bundle protein [Ignavibacteria bacterium GWB2_35_12]OGU94554.1 MAG: four helix bundle protein [Ignavibacteria bacterium RIFOXYA2_FULL_35_10]OGV22431.1 MAG: four helix bundle protein [Ignavibacteria bacterium RIFOXYC2_FULL_35_21]
MKNEKNKSIGNLIIEKSYNFALRIVKLYKYLSENKKEFVIAKQVLRCGTSIGANIYEAQSAETKKDFIHKMGIALKEAKETIYWLNLLKDSDYIDVKSYNSITLNCDEIIKLISKIISTSKKNITNEVK